MKNSQKRILNKIANDNNLTIQQVEEIWSTFCNKIALTISDLDKKDENGLYDPEKFKVIHIDNLGKFKPNLRNIRHANMCLKQKKE